MVTKKPHIESFCVVPYDINCSTKFPVYMIHRDSLCKRL